ncbi:MAG: hypothetical protein GY940_33570 [bacterium]|nr:hypothetical protein [bacterium]
METMVIDTVVKNSSIRIPPEFNNKRVKIIIIDSEEKEVGVEPQKLDFKIDESLEDVVPFADVEDTGQFLKTLRDKNWS